MKIEIDTNTKTIKVNESVNLGELFKFLNNFFPDFSWHEYTMLPLTDTTTWHTSPIVIQGGVWPTTTSTPFLGVGNGTMQTLGSLTSSGDFKDGVYLLDVKK